MFLEHARREVVHTAREISRLGLVQGTAGNVSVRDPETGCVAITPSAVPYDAMQPDDIVVVNSEGDVVNGPWRPSSETPMHTRVYRHKPWAFGIVHTHSVYATTFACLGVEIPAVHYVIAFAGPRIPVANYAPYGTDELGERVVQAMGDGKAVLLRNHGVLAAGRTVAEALNIAEVVEYVATLYYRTRSIGKPLILPDDEIERIRLRLEQYRPGEIDRS